MRADSQWYSLGSWEGRSRRRAFRAVRVGRAPRYFSTPPGLPGNRIATRIVKGKTTRGFVAHWPLITIHRLYQRPLSAYTAPVQRNLSMDRIADDTRIN